MNVYLDINKKARKDWCIIEIPLDFSLVLHNIISHHHHETSLQALEQVLWENDNAISIPSNRAYHSHSEAKGITSHQHPPIHQTHREEEPHNLLHQKI